MPDKDLLRTYIDAGVAFTELSRKKAEKIVKDFVRSGEVSRKDATARVEELLDRSRANTEALVGLVRKEIDERITQLNLVTGDDVAALLSRLGVPLRGATSVTTTKAPAPKKAAPKKAPVKKAPVKKAPVKKAPVKKAPVKKAPVKKA